MMNQVNTPLAMVAIAATCLSLLFIGCETESVGDQDIRITPESATITINESITLTASGGFEYTWDLADDTIGVLSSRRGDTTVYTSRSDPGTNNNATTIQTVTVTSSVSSGGAGTNGIAGLIGTAQARIEHLGVPDADDPVVEDDEELAVSPSSRSFDVFVLGDLFQEFTASGGDGSSYSWALSDGSFGFLSNLSGSQTTYTYTNTTTLTGTITLTCSSGGQTFNVPISHF